MAGPKLGDGDELLHRNIHPSWIDDGKPSSLAFTPSAKDDGKLSLDRASIDTPAASYERHTEAKGLKSEAIFGASVSEFGAQHIDCFEDPIAGNAGEVENLAHCLADFSGLSKKQVKVKARRIGDAANVRGKLHP